MYLYDVTLDRRVKPKGEPDKDWQYTIRIGCSKKCEAIKKANKLIKSSYPQYYIVKIKRHR
jgi:hypothetical protein